MQVAKSCYYYNIDIFKNHCIHGAERAVEQKPIRVISKYMVTSESCDVCNQCCALQTNEMATQKSRRGHNTGRPLYLKE